jgi:hypothetical protein
MPTRYTAIIVERADLTFREFALRCARAMGACVMQRDDPTDDLPKAPEPSDYYEKQKVRAEARLVELRGLNKEGIRALWQAECERIGKSNAESTAKAKETERRYARMRKMVAAWEPPTKDHDGLRRFMLEQIDMCSSDWTPYTTVAPATPGDWYAAALKSAEWDLDYATKHAAEEVDRAADRKAWIDALYASV